MKTLQIGDQAPEILGINQDGQEINQELRQAGYEVIGVSADSQKSHQGFIAKHNLPLTSLPIQTRSCPHYSVLGEKLCWQKIHGYVPNYLYHQRKRGIERIILPKQIKTKDHAAQIL